MKKILTGSIAEFASGPSVAQARYRKDIKEKDSNRAESNYTRSALTGAAVGVLARKAASQGRGWIEASKPGMTRGRAAAIGAGAGIAAQGALRIATSGTKDQFGDRSHAAKVVEKLPWQAGAITAGALALRKARSKIAGITAPLRKVRQVFASAKPQGVTQFSTASLRKAVLHGTALAGGITAADVLTSAAMPEGKKRSEAAKHGLAKGALYGTGLALTEPAILAALKRIPARKISRIVRASARPRGVVQFGGRQQILDDQNRYADPLKVASGNAQGYTRDNRGVLNPVDIPVQHAQVVRAAYNKAGTIYKHGTRAGGLLKDVHAVATGQPKEAGRKREWDKAWFRRAVGSAVVAGGVLAHTHTMRKNPVYRAKVNSVVKGAKQRANRIVPDLFPTFSARRRVIQFAKPFHGYNKKRHARTGGLNDDFREKYNREHGSDLKRPVTTAPSKLKTGSKADGRRKSFCARMGGVSGPTSKGGELTPKGAALKRWNCSALPVGVVAFATPEERRGHPVATAAVTAGALGGIGLLTHRGLKAVGSLQKRGAAAIRRVHATAGETVRDTIKTRLNPAIDEIRKAGANTKNATSIYADAGKIWNDVKDGGIAITRPGKLIRETKAAYHAGRHTAGDPDSLPSRIGRTAGKIYRKAAGSLPSLAGMQWEASLSRRIIAFAQSLDKDGIAFDYTAPEWDVRDQRGRSARVFAPGARARERREKKWHEKVDNIRRIGVIGTVAGLAGGALLGYKLRGASAAPVRRTTQSLRKVIPFPKQA